MSSLLNTNILNRENLVSTLKQELIGPIQIDKETMTGIAVNYNEPMTIFYSSDKNKPRVFYFNNDSHEEIIHNGNTPITQYSSAILFPYSLPNVDLDDADSNSPLAEIDEEINIVKDESGIEEIQKRSEDKEQHETSNFMMNDNLPSSMAYTFYVSSKEHLSKLKFNILGGVYRGFEVNLIDEEKPEKGAYDTKWWAREQISFNAAFNELNAISDNQLNKSFFVNSLRLELQMNIRQVNSMKLHGFFVTISLTNCSTDTAMYYKNALFQVELNTTFSDNSSFLPYPTKIKLGQYVSEEELSNELLYSSSKTYALGHGCSVDWDTAATRISSSFMPEHEITNITPDIEDEEGNELKISMLDLAEFSQSEAKTLLTKITDSYKKWIEKKYKQIPKLPPELQEIATKHMDNCSFSLNRMEKGITVLEDEKIFKAFQLANLAMFIQQVSGGSIEKAIIENGKISYSTSAEKLTDLKTITELRTIFASSNKGYWRAFQIAFLLMSLPSLPKKAFSEREIADLIWFPTGGGKTEAYLGYAATTILYNRLIDSNDCGTDVLMRYTLRLLTADQFQRSARLICALELIRRKNQNLLGDKEISIGLWVGKKNTPNKIDKALEQLKDWKNTGYTKHEFLINHCPLCRSEMVRYEKNAATHGKKIHDIAGYKSVVKRGVGKQFVIYCPNSECTFHDNLPIYLIDEQLYQKQPTFIIGTVDKFAMLAWEPAAKSLFGLNSEGYRNVAPPSLIIQDELHLISGPLGSTVGIYETLIEELCTDYRYDITVKPKIICATATVKGYKEQIQALFNRKKENIKLFPSPGISQEDSFFAQIHKVFDPESQKYVPSRGRKYIGIASNLIGTQQLQVKVYTTVLQKVKQLDNPDPYWTLLAFYNSIRELGGSLTLFQTDISNYVLQYLNKHHVQNSIRYINNIKELTSRLESREVTNALAELKTPSLDYKAIDICLASNIIEVGVDVERLSLMSILGQPKNTAQYIQVSGRVGRAWYERPGLVLTLYKLSMSRDKSHFEHFKEYHQSLYKHVEATSLTPFSEPSIDRSLSGVMIAWLRQFGNETLSSSPATIQNYIYLFDDMANKILDRLEQIETSTSSKEYFIKKFSEIKNLLLSGSATLWNQKLNSNDFFYMYSYGSYVPHNYEISSLPVLTSMRNVDASCQGTISNVFNIRSNGEEENV